MILQLAAARSAKCLLGDFEDSQSEELRYWTLTEAPRCIEAKLRASPAQHCKLTWEDGFQGSQSRACPAVMDVHYKHVSCLSFNSTLYNTNECRSIHSWVWSASSQLYQLIRRAAAPPTHSEHATVLKLSGCSLPHRRWQMWPAAFCWRVIRPSVPFLWTRYLRNVLRERLSSLYRHPLKCVLINIWQKDCDLTFLSII